MSSGPDAISIGGSQIDHPNSSPSCSLIHEEGKKDVKLQAKLGNKWSQISVQICFSTRLSSILGNKWSQIAAQVLSVAS